MNSGRNPEAPAQEAGLPAGTVSCPFTLADAGDLSFPSQGDAGPAAWSGETFWSLRPAF